MAKSYGFKLTQAEEYPRFVLTSYLKPVQSGVQLVVNRRTTTSGNPSEYLIDEGNITEYSSEVNYISIGGFVEMHLSYIKNGQVYYKYIKFTLNGIYAEDTPMVISSDDGFLYNRNSVDISLRNTRPVITYAGAYDMSKIVIHENMNGGQNNETQTINLNFYPIVVKYKTSNNIWSQSFRYNSSGNNTQQNPDVEGSTNQNAHLLNFSLNNSIFKKFVRIDDPNYSNYYCSPSYFYGKDAKLIKGSYTNFTDGSPALTTLSEESNLFRVGQQNFSITNNQNPEHDRAFSNLFGTFDITGINYMFNLGPILISNVTEELDDDKNNIYIQNFSDFNEYLSSNTFKLNEGDTLILGTTGIYKNDTHNEVAPVRYRVDLINKTFESIHRVLFYDTITVEDSVEINYLRGFVIENIPNGNDSFYVKIEIDPSDTEGAGGFGVGGEYPSEPSEGDNIPFKTKIFFENDSPVNSSILPTEYSLSQNFPNPFNPVTTISYQIPTDGIVNLKVYDILGKEVATLVSEMKRAGSYQVVFNGNNLASGIYFYKIQSGNYNQVKRMMLIK